MEILARGEILEMIGEIAEMIKRDKRDDQSDLQQQIARTNRQKQILNTLEAFTFSFEPSASEKAIANIKLMDEFLQTMEADIAATKVELAEGQARAKRR